MKRRHATQKRLSYAVRRQRGSLPHTHIQSPSTTPGLRLHSRAQSAASPVLSMKGAVGGDAPGCRNPGQTRYGSKEGAEGKGVAVSRGAGMNLELYGYALGETLASGDESDLPEPEPPVEHAPDCRCYQCQHDPFFRGISEAIRAHVLVTEVPEAARQESALESYRNPSIYAGSRASSDSFEPLRTGGYEILDSRELARRWRVPKTWVEEQTRRRCSDPIPHIRLGKYVRFEWGSPELERWWARRRKTRR